MQYTDYRIAWISALPIELAVALGMLDQVHEQLPRIPHDDNQYIFGSIGAHNVVLACLPAGAVGTVSTASVAYAVQRTFPALEFGVLVGIGGGVPDMEAGCKHDIRLGDVVVSQPAGISGGIVQYDFGKTIGTGSFQRMGMLNRPPPALLSAVSVIQAEAFIEARTPLLQFLDDMYAKHPNMAAGFASPGPADDVLFSSRYDHQPGPHADASCAFCDLRYAVHRPARSVDQPRVHYGVIASGNQVMRHGSTRDQVASETDALCYEMEAAGLMNTFPCLVIRGICDYSDSHKNKQWQPYAAAVAAAYAKLILYKISAPQIAYSSPASSHSSHPVPWEDTVTNMNSVQPLLDRSYTTSSFQGYGRPARQMSEHQRLHARSATDPSWGSYAEGTPEARNSIPPPQASQDQERVLAKISAVEDKFYNEIRPLIDATIRHPPTDARKFSTEYDKLSLKMSISVLMRLEPLHIEEHGEATQRRDALLAEVGRLDGELKRAFGR